MRLKLYWGTERIDLIPMVMALSMCADKHKLKEGEESEINKN
jgi:hypothetical protein